MKKVTIDGVIYSLPINIADWFGEQKAEAHTLSEIVYNLKKAPIEIQDLSKNTMNFEIIKKLLKDKTPAPIIKKQESIIIKKNILIKEERNLEDSNAVNDLMNQDRTIKVSGDKYFNKAKRQFLLVNKTLREMNTVLTIRGLEGYFFIRPDEDSTLCCLLSISGDVKVIPFLVPKDLKKFFELSSKEQMIDYAREYLDSLGQ